MLDWIIGENLQSVKLEMCLGQPSPVASTGMSSYFSKLMPVLVSPNSSLQACTHPRLFTVRVYYTQAVHMEYTPHVHLYTLIRLALHTHTQKAI